MCFLLFKWYLINLLSLHISHFNIEGNLKRQHIETINTCLTPELCKPSQKFFGIHYFCFTACVRILFLEDAYKLVTF